MLVVRKDQGDPIGVKEARCHLKVAHDASVLVTGIMPDDTHISLVLHANEAAELFALLRTADAAVEIRTKAEAQPSDPGRTSNW